MNNDQLRRVAGVSAIISAPLAFGSILFGIAAVGPESANSYSNPASTLTIGAHGALLYRWSGISDLFGYYLLLLPLTVYLWEQLKPRNSGLVALYSICGIAYVLIGAIGASINAAVLPPMILAYASASPSAREILEWLFGSFYLLTFQGLFNPLEMIVGGVWWLGMGSLLRPIRPSLGSLSMAVGLFACLDAFGTIIQIEWIFMAGLAGILLLIPLWALWSGINLLRRPLISPGE